MEQLKTLMDVLNTYAINYVNKHENDDGVKCLGFDLSVKCVRRMYYFYLIMTKKYDDGQTYTMGELNDLAIDAVDYFYETNTDPIKFFL